VFLTSLYCTFMKLMVAFRKSAKAPEKVGCYFFSNLHFRPPSYMASIVMKIQWFRLRLQNSTSNLWNYIRNKVRAVKNWINIITKHKRNLALRFSFEHFRTYSPVSLQWPQSANGCMGKLPLIYAQESSCDNNSGYSIKHSSWAARTQWVTKR
jgi:hypothetical protein